jgi:hypothetical protein
LELDTFSRIIRWDSHGVNSDVFEVHRWTARKFSMSCDPLLIGGDFNLVRSQKDKNIGRVSAMV